MSFLRKGLHKLTRDGGLPRVTNDLEEHNLLATQEDPRPLSSFTFNEFAARAQSAARKVRTRRDRICVGCLVIATVSAVWFAIGLFRISAPEEDPVLANMSRLLHPAHSSSAPSTDEKHPYAQLSVLRYETAESVPEHFFRRCRDLTEEEIIMGRTIKGHLLPELIHQMCTLIHDAEGCKDSEGTLVPKLLNGTIQPDNFCLITYKDANGVCHHYFNPHLMEIGSASMRELTIYVPSFPYLDEHIVNLPNQTMMRYQPIVHEDPLQGFSNEQENPLPSQQYVDALKNVERVARSTKIWISSLPAIRIMSFSKSRAFHIAFANSLLMGNYPAHGYLPPLSSHISPPETFHTDPKDA